MVESMPFDDRKDTFRQYKAMLSNIQRMPLHKGHLMERGN